MIEELKSLGVQVEERNCSGVYDKIIKVKYGVDPHDLGWIYFKDNKILLIHIKNENFDTVEQFVQRLKEIKN